MLANLRIIKDRIVGIRRELPKKKKTLEELLEKVNELENTLLEIGEWLDEGEFLLSSHRIDGDILKIEGRFISHMVSYPHFPTLSLSNSLFPALSFFLWWCNSMMTWWMDNSFHVILSVVGNVWSYKTYVHNNWLILYHEELFRQILLFYDHYESMQKFIAVVIRDFCFYF